MDKSSEQERFIGGAFFYGMIKGFSRVYGIYATSNRIVGVKPNALPYVLIPAATIGILALFATLASLAHILLLILGGLVLVIIAVIWIMKRFGQKDPTTISELDVRKNLEIFRRDISRIEVKKAGLRSGHLKITASTGEMKFALSSKFGAYDQLKALMVEFCSISPQIEFAAEGV